MTSDTERRPGGYSEAAESLSRDCLKDTTDQSLLARMRKQAARDPRSAMRREQRIARRRQRHFESFVQSDPAEPQSFGLTPEELRRHAADLRVQGWSAEEIRARLADPRQVAA